jgi:hypothetical protein
MTLAGTTPVAWSQPGATMTMPVAVPLAAGELKDWIDGD